MKTSCRKAFHRLTLALPLLLFLASSPLLAASSEAAKEQELMQKTMEVAEGKLALNGVTNDTWLIASWEFVKTHSVSAWNWLSSHVKNVLTEDFEVDYASPLAIGLLVAFLSVMTLSGAWAASIAQTRRHPRVKFFCIGFFTFFIYPAWLLYNLDIKGEKEMLERLAQESAAKKAEAEARAAKEKAALADSGELPQPAVSATGVVWDQNYFNSIQRKSDGTPDGPWQVTYNGVHVKVLEIIEVLPTVVAVRLRNQEGNELNGRIPFTKIEQWDRII